MRSRIVPIEAPSPSTSVLWPAKVLAMRSRELVRDINATNGTGPIGTLMIHELHRLCGIHFDS